MVEEVDLSKDINHWNKLTDDERHFLKYVLAFFASFDGIINENLVENFYCEIQIPEARNFYGFQIMIENIHNEMYSLLIQKFGENDEERNRLLSAVKEFPAIMNMQTWASKWGNKDRPFNERILVYTFIEGVWFSGPFCAIYYFKKRGLLPGLTFSNELISKDESLHMEFGILMHKKQQTRATQQVAHAIAEEIVQCAVAFITESLPCNLIGMNNIDMTTYIKYITDRLLTQLGYYKLYHVSNPFPWMEMISLETKTNFFERKVSQYAKAKVGESATETQQELLDDF
jgi:ribonucleoside-diphosphate reductase subunit M2